MGHLDFGKTNLERLINIALIFTILAIPLSPIWNSVSLIFLGILSMVGIFLKREIVRPPMHLWLLGMVFIVRILWLAKSEDIKYGLESIETEAPLLAVPLIILFSASSIKSRSIIVWSYIIMAFSVILYSFYNLSRFIYDSDLTILEYVGVHFETAQYYAQKNMLKWSFAHYTFLSVILIQGLHLIVFSTKHKLRNWTILLYSILLLIFIIFSGSRIGIVLFVFSFLVYFLIFMRRKYQLIFVTTLLVVAFFLIIKYKNNFTEYIIESEPMRVQLFEIASKSIGERPFFGGGTGSQAMVFDSIRFVNQFDFDNKIDRVSKVNHPHNQYLTELLQFGFVGAIPLFLFFLTVILFALRARDYALLTVSLTSALFMMVESPLNSNKGVFPFALLISLLTVTNPKISGLGSRDMGD